VNGLAGRIPLHGTLDELGLRVMFCGYIAEPAALCSRLGIDATPKPAHARLIAHAYRAWGRELQAHVLGEYAAVVYDPRDDVALLTHDALGLVPLYYVDGPDGLAFSTHLPDLVDAATSNALDDEYLADFLALGVVSTERTPYPSIRRLLPGQSLWWSNGTLRVLRTWNLADAPAVRCRDDAEYEERFRTLLGEAVRSASETTGSLWSDLSGGLDSSSVTSVAARSGRELTAFSVVSEEFPETDERRWMRAVVDQYALPWQQLRIEDMLPFARLPGEFVGEPTPSAINAEYHDREHELLTSAGATTLLTGHGGDAVLGAFPGSIATHLADPLFEGRPIAALRDVAAWRNGSGKNRSYSYWLLRSLVEPAVSHLRGRDIRASAYLPVQPWLEADYVRSAHLSARFHRRHAPRCRQPGRQQLWDALWTSVLSLNADAQRSRSYDVRYPLLHRPLVEFMCGIPWQQKLRPRCDRYLQRRALEGVLPEIVRRRASKAAGSRALCEGLRRSRDWFAYLTDDSLLARRGIVDSTRWRHAVRQAALGETHGDQFFLAGVAVEAFLRQLDEYRTARPHPRSRSVPAG
jgi:asparagine synthase (glutamine-hydrolysing)